MADYTDPLDQLVDNPGAFVQQIAAPIVNARVGQLEHQVGQLHTTLNQERVQRALDADPQLAGRWRQLNHDEGFLRWLDQVDPLSNERRSQMLTRAYNLGASDRVAAFFLAFLAEQLPKSQRTSERLPFEQSRPTPSVTERDLTRGRVWTRPEIARFYEDVRRGRYADRDVERMRIERAIADAAKGGRVANPPEQFHK